MAKSMLVGICSQGLPGTCPSPKACTLPAGDLQVIAVGGPQPCCLPGYLTNPETTEGSHEGVWGSS